MSDSDKGAVSPEEIRKNLSCLGNLCFEVTDSCNLACDYCVYRDLYEDHDKRNNKMMSFEMGKTVVDYLVSLWKEYPTGRVEDSTGISFYGGEPLLNMPFITRMVSYIESLDVDRTFTFNMTTNGMLLRKNIDYLVEKEFNLLISLDGDRYASGHRLTHNGEESFQTVFNNAKFIKEHYPSYFEKHVSFNSVLHNLNDVKGIREFFKQQFDVVPMVSPVNDRGLKPSKGPEFKSIHKSYIGSIRELSDSEKMKGEWFYDNPYANNIFRNLILSSDNYYGDYNHLLLPDTYYAHRRESSICWGTCIPFSRKMFITVNGKILQCERIGHQHWLGFVTDASVKLDFEGVANRHNQIMSQYSMLCSKCKNRKSCLSCVLNMQKEDSATATCTDFCSEEEYKYYQEEGRKYLSKHPEIYRRLIEEVKFL